MSAGAKKNSKDNQEQNIEHLIDQIQLNNEKLINITQSNGIITSNNTPFNQMYSESGLQSITEK